MRLLEYSVNKFYKDCKFSNNKRHTCSEAGFLFGMHEFQNLDFWLENKENTDIDFIEAICVENIENKQMDETELLSNLARFLCGYDVQVSFREEALQLPVEKRSNFFLNKKEGVDNCVTEKAISEKIKFIKQIVD